MRIKRFPIILSASLPILFHLLFCGELKAQNSRFLTETIPTKYDFSLEAGILPGEGKIIDLGSFSSRFYLSDKYFLRLGVEFDIYRNKKGIEDYRYMLVDERSDYWGLSLGIARRFLSKSKISPYIGLDMTFGQRQSRGEYIDSHNIKTTTDGVIRKTEEALWVDESWYDYYTITSYDERRAFRSYGANLVFGADFYILRHIYLGFEMDLGFKYVRYSAIELHKVGPWDEEHTYPAPKQTDITAGLNVKNAIRLGVWF